MGQKEYTMWSGQGGYDRQGGYAYGQDNNGQSQREKPSSDHTRYALSNLKREFDGKAADYTRMSTAIGDAIQLLDEADKMKAEIAQLKTAEARRQSADDLAGLLAKFGKADEVWIFGDGSGSMSALRGKYKSAMEEALDGMEDVAKAAAKSGYKGAKTYVWGDQKPLQINFDQVPSPASAFRNGLGCGTDLEPVAKMLSSAPTNKKPHYVILSDGDVFDPKNAAPAFGQALGKNPDATIDFVIFTTAARGNYDTEMEKLARDMAKVFPSQVRVVKADISQENGFSTELTKLLRARLPQPGAAPKKKYAPGGASPA